MTYNYSIFFVFPLILLGSNPPDSDFKDTPGSNPRVTLQNKFYSYDELLHRLKNMQAQQEKKAAEEHALWEYHLLFEDLDEKSVLK